ncbi:unnamed protein product [Acanthoscelides obtectus]|uniref:Uncharacterized protein n=1 Tax=Acanthoscelides obtectus TaxID=200917 RepID=A0A9P0L0E4_ACAOB|nr:unnamed protein product [Acanthoscelides obtectus]CAK1663024.1 hypothetical protein AOBTE_LOCUS23437 [Acanthoscelides obtectus]
MIAQVVLVTSLLALAHAGGLLGNGIGIGGGIGLGESRGIGGGLGGVRIGHGIGGLGGIGIGRGIGGIGGGLGGIGGGIGGAGVGLGSGVGHGRVVDVYAPPHYEYKYEVADPHTGDLKQQVESRVGDRTKSELAWGEKDRQAVVSRLIQDTGTLVVSHGHGLGR